MDPENELSIRSHRLIKWLNPKHIGQLIETAQELTIPAGGYLWRQGNWFDGLFLIRSGLLSLEISIPNQGPLELASFRDGEACGNWLQPKPSEFDLRAVTTVYGALLSGEVLRSSCDQHPSLGYQLSKYWAVFQTNQLLRTQRLLIEPRIWEAYKPVAPTGTSAN